jgi:hypothetical protein
MLPQDETTFRFAGVSLPLTPAQSDLYKRISEMRDFAPISHDVATLIPFIAELGGSKCKCKCAAPAKTTKKK